MLMRGFLQVNPIGHMVWGLRACEPQPEGRGGGRASAASPLLDDDTASPASRRLASTRQGLAPICEFISALALRLFAVLLICAALSPGYPGIPRVSDNPEAIVRQVVENELQAQAGESICWRYIVQTQEADKSRTDLVIETREGTLKRLVSQNGRPLTPQQSLQEDRRLLHLIQDRRDLEKQKREEAADSLKVQRLFKMLPDAFVFTLEAADEQTLRLSFVPNPKFNPPTFESKIFRVLQGSMLVDASRKRLVEVRGRLLRDLDFGFGLFGKLNKGGILELRQTEIEPGRWVVAFVNVQVTGRAWFFRTVGMQRQESRMAFQRVAENLTLEAAAEMAKAAAHETEKVKPVL
jgi:hypothetical protein